jgi:hypothetical protein
VPTKPLWTAILIVTLSLVLATPARAASLETEGDLIVLGIVVVSAAVAAAVTVLVLHQKHKNAAITGCVTSMTGGLNLIDDKDKRSYMLSGMPPGVKAGDRMTIEGRRRAGSGNTRIFEARSVTHDLGLCQP